MLGFVQARLEDGQHMAGVLIVPATMTVGAIIEDLVYIVECTDEADWQDRIEYLPL